MLAVLSSVAALLSALQAGHTVRYAALYQNCSLDGGPGVRAAGGAAIKSFTITGRGELLFEAHELIADYQSTAGDFVFDVVSTRVWPNGTVFIQASDVPAPDPNASPPIYTETFECQIDVGIKFFTADHRPRDLSDYNALIHASTHGRSIRAVYRDDQCQGGSAHTVSGVELGTFESFDAARFGGRYLASGSSALVQRSDSTWVVRQTAIVVAASALVNVTFTDLDPGTLQRVPGSPAPLHCTLNRGFQLSEGPPN